MGSFLEAKGQGSSHQLWLGQGPPLLPKALHPHASGLTRSGSSEPHLTGGGGGAGMQWQQITHAKNWMIMPAAVTCSGQDRGAGRREGGLLRAPEAR